MFINLSQTFTFIQLKATLYTGLLLLMFPLTQFSQLTVKGVVLDDDSSSVMPFVFVINQRNGNGTVSNNDGRFSINTSDTDTLLFSFVGYSKKYVSVSSLKNVTNREIKIYLTRMPVNLNAVTITGFRIKPYEREYMKDVIERNSMSAIDKFNSPFTALYMQYSKEGKQVRKLAEIFENLMVEEQVQRKLNPEILRRLTGDESIDYAAFRKYCFQLSNDYILHHDGFDLYTKVMDCYRHYKYEGH
jgi:hypothetical protein